MFLFRIRFLLFYLARNRKESRNKMYSLYGVLVASPLKMLAPEPRLLGYAASLASLGSGFIAVGAPRHNGKTGVVDIAHSSRLRTSAGRLFGENPGCLFGSAVAALVQWPRRAVVAVGEPCPEEPTGRVSIVELELRAGGTVVAEKNRPRWVSFLLCRPRSRPHHWTLPHRRHLPPPSRTSCAAT